NKCRFSSGRAQAPLPALALPTEPSGITQSSIGLPHKLGQQRLKARIASQRIESLVRFQAVGVSTHLNAAFFISGFEELQRLFLISESKINQRDRITLDKLVLPAGEQSVEDCLGLRHSASLRVEPRDHCFADRGLGKVGCFFVQY